MARLERSVHLYDHLRTAFGVDHRHTYVEDGAYWHDQVGEGPIVIGEGERGGHGGGGAGGGAGDDDDTKPRQVYPPVYSVKPACCPEKLVAPMPLRRLPPRPMDDYYVLFEWFWGAYAKYRELGTLDGAPCACSCCQMLVEAETTTEHVETDSDGNRRDDDSEVVVNGVPLTDQQKSDRESGGGDPQYIQDCRYRTSRGWLSQVQLGGRVSGFSKEDVWCLGQQGPYPTGLPEMYKRMQHSHNPCEDTIIDTPGAVAQKGRAPGWTSTTTGGVKFRVKIWDTCQGVERASVKFQLGLTVTLDAWGRVLDGPDYADGGEVPSSRFRGANVSALSPRVWGKPSKGTDGAPLEDLRWGSGESVARTLHTWVRTAGRRTPQ